MKPLFLLFSIICNVVIPAMAQQVRVIHPNNRMRELLTAYYKLAPGTGKLAWSTLEDFKKAEKDIPKKIAWLEKHPLAKTQKDTARYVFLWAMQAPHIKLYTNWLYLEKLILTYGEWKYLERVGVMLAFGELAYLLKHPRARTMEPNAVKAGIQSLLRTYDTVVKSDPQAVHPVFEDLKRMIKSNLIFAHIKRMNNRIAQLKANKMFGKEKPTKHP